MQHVPPAHAQRVFSLGEAMVVLLTSFVLYLPPVKPSMTNANALLIVVVIFAVAILLPSRPSSASSSASSPPPPTPPTSPPTTRASSDEDRHRPRPVAAFAVSRDDGHAHRETTTTTPTPSVVLLRPRPSCVVVENASLRCEFSSSCRIFRPPPPSLSLSSHSLTSSPPSHTPASQKIP
jgi:hypothetical protein